MASIEDIFKNFAIVVFIILGVFSFIIIIQSNNNAEQPLINDDRFNDSFYQLNNSLSKLESTSTNQKDAFLKENPKTGFASIVLFTIVNVGRTFGNIIFGIFSLIIKLPLTVLGIPATVTSILLSILTIAILISLWITYKIGG